MPIGANRAFAEMLGLTADAVLARRFVELLRTAPGDGASSFLQRSMPARVVDRFEDVTERLWLRGRR